MKTLSECFGDVPNRTEVCEIHGEFISRNFFKTHWTKCPACSEEKRKEQDAIDAENRRIDHIKWREEQWVKKVGASGIPERFKDRTLESFVANTEAQRKALDFAMEYANRFEDVARTGKSALFIGKPGTGKTHLSVGIALRAMQDGHTALFTTVIRAIRRIKDSWSRDSDENETSVIESFVFPDLLVFDEVGVQFGSETERLYLFDILNERYENRKPTILLSNLSIAEVKTFLGERAFDRLREDGGQAIIFDWDSHRGKS